MKGKKSLKRIALGLKFIFTGEIPYTKEITEFANNLEKDCFIMGHFTELCETKDIEDCPYFKINGKYDVERKGLPSHIHFSNGIQIEWPITLFLRNISK
jgi:hypothetical protein